ncbi:MOSC domain-containing protein [Intrasporangium sp. YIM S08009]|uniref:MOSC domain-containing protein n=1 Tax=Intrasporangium zincisolvens TaxID=3080018 RepID=UPI002B05AF14|nr:MOSC N-terminal beta barrel domain-containing protein [Intrasporangium sp. YIM S08009]
MSVPGPAPDGLRVVALHVHPVKSLAGVSPTEAALDERGIGGDRRWAVVDPDGTKVTAREEHSLLGLRAEPLPGGDVRLLDASGAAIDVPRPVGAEPVPVGFSGQSSALPAGEAVDAWLTERVGRPLRLVWQDEHTARPVRADLGGEAGDRNSLSDAAPLHVTTDASLARLNDWLLETALERGEEPREPLGHDRFRPNVVVDGEEPFAEDSWRHVTIGDVPFRATMVCDRCVMTTIDRTILTTSKEPIRTLARHRRWEGATWFGIRLTPVLPVAAGAVLRVGDEVVTG